MRELTGRHVFAITVSAFGVIIGVNLVMAYKAVSTFPGVEVASSYTAGVGFDARRSAQVALGWDVVAGYAQGALRVDFRDAGGTVRPNDLAVMVGRVTEAADDRTADVIWDGVGFAVPMDLGPGLWRVDVTASAADGTAFQRRLEVRVRP
jgi:nitrogen fixation protein FixH